jgi:hypothetical protein
MSGIEAVPGIRMENAGNWNPSLYQQIQPGKWYSTALSAAR